MPDEYVGVWKRTLLRTPASEDTTSTVFWLQTPRWHADIRIPSTCIVPPDLTTLDACDRSVLGRLARQEGFTGITTVEGDVCRWHRRHDFQPPSEFADVGRIEFGTPDRMLEYGTEQDYFEIWDRLPGSTGAAFALERTGTTRPEYLLRAGRYAMRVRPRHFPLAPHRSLEDLAGSLDDDELRSALDFEISFCHRGETGAWTITHSTLPWLRQTPLAEPEVLEAAAEGAPGMSARHWRPLD